MARKMRELVEKPHTLYEINGEKHGIIDWCRIYDIPYEVVRKRMACGYYLEEALSEPYKFVPRGTSMGTQIEVGGQNYASLRQLAKAYNMDVTTLYARYRKGLRGDDLVAPVKTRKKKANLIE